MESSEHLMEDYGKTVFVGVSLLRLYRKSLGDTMFDQWIKNAKLEFASEKAELWMINYKLEKFKS